MKKIMCKSLSVFLAVIMLFTAIPMLVSAETADAPEFAVEKTSETATSLELVLKLTSGSFKCFDATVTVKDLECTMAITAAAFEDFIDSIKTTGENGIDCEYAATGKVSVSVTESCTAPMDIVVYTFKKSESKGVNGSDVSFTVDFCCVDNGEGGEKEVTENIKAEVALPETHVHAAGEWTTVTPAACNHKGAEELYCTECGELVDSREIPMTEHANTKVYREEATCTTDGYRDIYCLDCGEQTWHAVIPATGHVETYEDIKPATCTESGYRKVICKKCKEVLESETYPAINHAKTHEEKAAATCTTDGYDRIVCDDCGKVMSEVIYPAKGHGATHTVRTEPTCTVDGSIAEVCEDCNQAVSSVVLPATGHSEEYNIDGKAATCTENGYVRYLCQKCGGVIEENIIPSTGHKIVEVENKATCHQTGSLVKMCSLCHEVISTTTIPKTSHKWGEWHTDIIAEPGRPGLRTRVCEICGDVQENVIPAPTVPVQGIEMSVNEVSLNYKKSISLYADIVPASSGYSNAIVWKSSNTRVATVDQNGVVTATGTGTATITASTADGRYKDTCQVTVSYSWLQLIIIYVLFGWLWY